MVVLGGVAVSYERGMLSPHARPWNYLLVTAKIDKISRQVPFIPHEGSCVDPRDARIGTPSVTKKCIDFNISIIIDKDPLRGLWFY
jgi:hypothetical protein